MEITFLGTSSMVPTKERNHTSIYINLGKESLLIDCGEGTQRQLKIAGIKPSKISAILITHWHGDHVLGIPGLIQTMAAQGYDRKLKIYGPKTTKKRMKHMFEAFLFDNAIDIEIKEISIKETRKKVMEIDNHKIYAYQLNHAIETLGYRIVENDKRRMIVKELEKYNIKGEEIGILQKGKSIKKGNKTIKPDNVSRIEKGKKLGIILDTSMSENVLKIAENVDVLICEATYHSDLKEKAEDYLHLTAEQSATIASNANAKKLILTHFSSRYKDVGELIKEARTIFPNTIEAYDFMKIKN